MKNVRGFLGVSLGALASTMLMAGMAQAQIASSGIRGEAAPGAEVTARNVDSGFTTRDTADADGDYSLSGLQPGTYDVTSAGGGDTVTRRVRVLVGQTSFLFLGNEAEGEELVVTADRLDDPTTSEVGTNVTREQIEGLPQFTRNFLNFAALAPGVSTTQESTGEVSFSGGGQPARSVNVFIDGQSQKAQIIDGGVAGQDDSRGNPFPQLAIQEFRVLTQNFGAQYDTASSSIITSVTRSGTNDLSVEAFGTYQPTDFVEQHHLGGNTSPDPETERQQYGIAIGGPIMQDQFHFFVAYEGRQDDKFANVFLGRPGYEARFGDFEGTVATPFEQDLIFAKVSIQPTNNQRFDISATYRDERDIRDVGGQDAAERANVLDISELKLNLRHDWQGDSGWSNIIQADFLESNYNPTAQNFSSTGQEHILFRDSDTGAPGFQFNFFSQDGTVIRLGGRDSNQDIQQQTWTLRDDFTFPELNFAGEHSLSIGARFAFNHYFVEKGFNRNPFFSYDVDGRAEINGDTDIPVRVVIGSPVPAVSVTNNVTGFYIQDDWQLTDRLEINLGLRWDYEDNAYNNDYTTPDRIVDLLNAYRTLPGYTTLAFDPDEYIADGDREAFTEAWQPRLGFSYDLFGNEQTVIFGGAGRYYDRVPYNFAFDERFKPTQFVREFFFSADGLRPGTIMWDPAFATPEGLQALIDASPGTGEVFLIKNGAEPPVTDQFNLGLRQRFGDWRTTITLSHAETRNGFGWYIGNLGTGPDPRFNGPTPSSLGFTEFRNLVFYSNHDQEREYNALYLTAEKPYTEDSGWGVSISYTLSEATQNGSRDTGTAPFDFDYPTIEETPTYPSANDEEHRIVASGLVDLPWNTRLSGLAQYGSGTPFTIFGPAPPDWNGGRREPFEQLDLRLTKFFDFEDEHSFEIFFDAINVFDHVNNPAIEQCNCSPNFEQANNQIVQGRSFQVGARARW